MQNVLQKDYPKLHTHACTHTHTHLQTGVYKSALGIKQQFTSLHINKETYSLVYQ